MDLTGNCESCTFFADKVVMGYMTGQNFLVLVGKTLPSLPYRESDLRSLEDWLPNKTPLSWNVFPSTEDHRPTENSLPSLQQYA